MSALSRFDFGMIGISRKSKFKKAQPFFEERDEEIEESEDEDLPIIPTYDSTSDISFDDSDLYGNTYEELSEERLPYGLFTNEETPINRKKRYNKILEPKGHRPSRPSDVSESFEAPHPAESILLSFNTPTHDINRSEISSPDVFTNTSSNIAINNSNSQQHFTPISPIEKTSIQKELSFTEGLNSADRQSSFINLFEKSDLTTSTEELDIFGKRFLEQSSPIQEYNVPDANLAKVQENAEKTKSVTNSKKFNDKLTKSFNNIDFSSSLQFDSTESPEKSQNSSNNFSTTNQSVLQELKAYADNEKQKENNSKPQISKDKNNNIQNQQKVTQNNKSSILPQNLLFLSSFENRNFDKDFIIKESHHKRERRSSSGSDSDIKPSRSRDITTISPKKSNIIVDEIISQQNNTENNDKVVPVEEFDVLNYPKHKKSKRKRNKIGDSTPVSIDDEKPYTIDEPVYMSPSKRLKVQKSKENIKFDSDFSDSPSKQRALSENDDLADNLMIKEEARPHISPNNNMINNILNNDQQLRQVIQEKTPKENNKPRLRRSKHQSHEEIIESLTPVHNLRRPHKSLNNDMFNEEEEDLPLFSQENDVFFTPKNVINNSNSSSEQSENVNSSEIKIPQSKKICVDSFDEKIDEKRNFIFSNNEDEKESTFETGESYNTFENDRNTSDSSYYYEEDYYEDDDQYEYDFDDGFDHNGTKKLDLFGPLSNFKSATAKSENSTIDSNESDEISSNTLIESNINNDDNEEEKISVKKHNHLPKPPPELINNDYEYEITPKKHHSAKKHKKRSSKVPKDEDFEQFSDNYVIPNDLLGESQFQRIELVNQKFSSPPSAEFMDQNLQILAKEEKKKKNPKLPVIDEVDEQINVDLINPNSNEINEDSDQISQELIPEYEINNPSSDPFKDVILPKFKINEKQQNNENDFNKINELQINEREGIRINEREGIRINEREGIQINEKEGIQINEKEGIQINEKQQNNENDFIKRDEQQINGKMRIQINENSTNYFDKNLEKSKNVSQVNDNEIVNTQSFYNDVNFQNQQIDEKERIRNNKNEVKNDFVKNDFTSTHQSNNDEILHGNVLNQSNNGNKIDFNDFDFQNQPKINERKIDYQNDDFIFQNSSKNNFYNYKVVSDDFNFQNEPNNNEKQVKIESDEKMIEDKDAMIRRTFSVPDDMDDADYDSSDSDSDPVVVNHIDQSNDFPTFEEDKSQPIPKANSVNIQMIDVQDSMKNFDPIQNQQKTFVKKPLSKNFDSDEDDDEEQVKERNISTPVKPEIKPKKEKLPKENKSEIKIEENVVEKKEKKKLTEEEKAKLKAEREEKERKHHEFLKKLEIDRINRKLKRYQKANNNTTTPPPNIDENNSKFKDDDENKGGIRQHMKPFEESKFLDENDNTKNKLKHRDNKEAPKTNYVASKFLDDDKSDSKDEFEIKEKPKQEENSKKEESPVKKNKFLNFSSDDDDFDLKPSPHKKPKGRIKPKRHKISSSSSDDDKSSKKKK
ncbi:hypothetical protein TVAG_099890 [Trichomonas vaginalis G3]|uniref:Uncharacterized protein n=1 Tax=Trichomonas vaginalis (strain ATCC PRA-98 / G3) TaxID=412133 RepID=A2EK56_TRIV3|nr:hypothetical protein TVAGG3_0838260 [Trichomonas vaginalis G3]EAY06949.1 hypothetical protein TVAG_099890 [Trichomonas vaginalis G3]KAI5499100.1 hypothetical protein TVAGG3_0838260 [Trichomonas vaginalis G3]|eukprot:XP_001319172.1 hypothetical protein [Trichomonas vaginalis G3]